ncbi:restriction endonuclease [Rhizobium leguminosarum]|uniref:restriction endonuclease n=1 Tax=Rhizobium leguminosarum TaxID=384 RepID=UPI001C97A9E7|nr:restriction endonuclease [Rhizobium leguminosarum]
MKEIAAEKLAQADLIVDAIYQGGRKGNAGDDPLPRLMRVDSQGGFRYRGKVKAKLEMLVLRTSMDDPDWPDALDADTGVFTYYGDNKEPGRDLHETGRDGNLILKTIFEDSRSGQAGREAVPPVFLFAKTGTYRDVRFLGLAVPGASDLDASEELVAIWRNVKNERFQNYRSRFTVLDAAVISRKWIDSIIAGQSDHSHAPPAWLRWRKAGKRTPLIAARTLEYRSRSEQLPSDKEGQAVMETIRAHFKGRPHAFEHCAAALARLMVPDIAALDVTRPSRDGGRDAVGQLRVGSGPSGILVDFALEAKCYTPPTAVGVKDMSRLISRLRHRQFGVLVTTSCLDLQAYKEIKEDQHPILVIAAADIVELLRRNGRGSAQAVSRWLVEEFPADV